MKKIVPVMLCVVLISFVFLCVSCKEKHVHDYESKIYEATCERKGYTKYTCECGDSYKDDYTDFAEHIYIEKIVSQASCFESGKKKFVCEECGDSYEKTYNAQEYSANEIYEIVKDSVGEIITYDKSGNELAVGSGFAYSKNGKILTNYHVIEGAYSAGITIAGKTYNVQQVLSYDKEIDLAVLKINASSLTVVDICSKEHGVGSVVYAFGSSKGLTDTFSQGIITYANREIDGIYYIQHDAAISGGNSGGPLINSYGEIIGVNTMTMKDSQNLNFAISAKQLSELVYDNPLSFSEFYEKECDVFTKVKNYVIQNGSYDSSDNDYFLTLGYTYSSDYSSKYTRMISYDVADDELCLMFFIDADNLVSIYIDEIDGVYDWSYVDTYDYYMSGTLYATTFTSNSLLGYSYNNISSSSIRTTIRNLASSMASLLITYTNTDFAEIGVTAVDLGFYYY